MTSRRLLTTGFVLTALLALPASGQAATITVDTLSDSVTGQCTLRQAITSANTDATAPSSSCESGSGSDLISLPANALPYTLQGTGGDNVNAVGDLDITADLTIDGAGRTATVIDGNGIDRVFNVRPGVTEATIQGLTITGGHGLNGPNGAPGADTVACGCIGDAHGFSGEGGFDGGAIMHESGTLTLDDVVLRGNAAGNGGLGGLGGVGRSDNLPRGGTGGLGGAGGAVAASAPLVIKNSLIENNSSGTGGSGGKGGTGRPGFPNSGDMGAAAEGGDAGAGGDGGAIATLTPAASVTISDSILQNNRAGRSGDAGDGGIAGAGGATGPGGISEGGDSTVAGNGGAIRSLGDLTITRSVITNNAAGDGGVGGDGGPGGAGNGTALGGSSLGGVGGAGGLGGAIRAKDGVINISFSEITDNSSGDGGNGGDGGTGGANATNPGSSEGGEGRFAGRGGGIYLEGTANGSISNTTIALNTTGSGGDGGDGGTGPKKSEAGSASSGGSFAGVAGQTASGTTILDFVTVAGNTTGAPGRPGHVGTGAETELGAPGTETLGADGVISSTNSILLRRSIVAYNVGGKPFCIGLATECVGGTSQCDGVFAAGSGNNVTFPAPATCASTTVNPLLGSLGLHGGLSRTLVPGAGSLALNGFAGAGCSGTDQRGVTRPKGGSCDFGAVERSLPSAVSDLASLVTRTDATLAGTVNPGELPTTYRFEYGTTTEYGALTPVVSAGGGAATVAAKAVLSLLTPGTVYHYRLRATNPDGTTVGVDRTFQTAPPPTPPKPLFAGVAVSSKTVRLDAKGKAPIRLSCPAGTAGTCSGTVTLTRVVTVKRKGKRVRKTETLGKAKFSIAPAKTKTINVTIKRSARKKTVKATLTAAGKDSNGTAKTLTGKLTFKPAKKKR